MQSQALGELYEKGVAPLSPNGLSARLIRGSDRPVGLRGDQFASNRPSLGKRMFRAIARFCIALLIGVGATLAWQWHGDEAKQMISTWLPALGQMLPASSATQNTTLPQLAPSTQLTGSAAARTSPEITPQLEPMARDLAEARRSLGQLADMARELVDVRHSLEQLAAKQEQIVQSIASLQTFQQNIKQKLASAPQSGSVPLPPRKPPQPASQSSAVKPSSMPPAPPSSREPLPLH